MSDKQIMDDYDAGFQAGQHDLNRIVAIREDLAYEKGLDRALFVIRNIDRQISDCEGEDIYNVGKSNLYNIKKDFLYEIYGAIKKDKGEEVHENNS